MATKYCMEVIACNDDTVEEVVPVALFSDAVPADVLHELCVTMFENTEGASTVVCIDMDTGEVVAEAAEPDPDFEDWGYNEDCGYDPYMGCYTDDC